MSGRHADASSAESRPVRNLVVVLGDQLNRDSAAWDGFDSDGDVVWMAEVAEESTHVPSAKPRIAMFLSAMRHFAADLRRDGVPLEYRRLGDPGNLGSLAAELADAVRRRKCARVVVVEPGEWRVRVALEGVAREACVPLEVRTDRHFLSTVEEFRRWLGRRTQPRMEQFYRYMRRRHGILMDGGEPAGGRWNFDEDNRGAFGPRGPGAVPAPARFEPDDITRGTIAEVEARFPGHPGRLATFAWPVTRGDALAALERFVRERLPRFGLYQDAMWSGEPWLYHAHLSAALNLKLLDPREVLARAELALREGAAPLSAVEGFARQILGWREYVRGIYWTRMPEYADGNALGAHAALPEFYWTGDTEMRCLREAIGQTLEHGYAHHIQRLMVTGLYALLLGVEPRELHRWYLAVYVDAVEWVELPNTLGMSQYADGGWIASKPYVATGKYIDRMSDYCRGCPYDPKKAEGERACPFTKLYWEFLERHADRFRNHPRMALQIRNLERKGVKS